MITAVWSGVPDRDELLAGARSLVARPERLDVMCLAGLVAARRVLESAGVEAAAIAERSHALLVGSAAGCLETDALYYGQIMDVGLERANPRLFAYTLSNMVLGEVAIANGFMGDQLAVSCGRASGLAALVEGAALIDTEEVELALVLVIDVLGPATGRLFDALGTVPVPIMAAFLLESRPSAGARGAAALATVSGGTAFGARRPGSWPDPDPLAGEGVDEVLAALGDGVGASLRMEARCTSGHTAWLELGPA